MRRRYAYIGLLLIALMFFSTFAFAALQSFSFFGSNQPPVTLPTTNIFDYDLTAAQTVALLNQGQTLLKFTYSSNCQECLQQKNLLENFVTSSEFKGQLYLEELTTPQASSALMVSSVYGQETVGNITQAEVTA